MVIGWFSAGVDSAVAIKIALKHMRIDKIIYTHIDDQHHDTIRFLHDCEEWFGQDILIWQSKIKTVKEACELYGKGMIHMPGIGVASCTEILKKNVRIQWEKDHQNIPMEYIWGLDTREKHRVVHVENAMPDKLHHFPLIEFGISKSKAHKILNASGIKRPEMYELGYNNNNCIGCVKGGMGYWNKIRQDFPEVFKERAAMERKIGHSCIKGIFLDELSPSRGVIPKAIVPDCLILCEMYDIDKY
jgi:hypothetical protein